jgi:hypothetical protein
MDNNFTKWTKWSDRNSLNGIEYPGIYCIAISETDLSTKLFEYIPELKYIGMTNSKAGLKGRLRQFDNTIKGKVGHGGADRFRYKYQDYQDLISNLFVSVCCFECNVESNKPDDLLIMGEVTKLEYVCFSEYVKKHGNLPEFNDKKGSKKYSLTFGKEQKI